MYEIITIRQLLIPSELVSELFDVSFSQGQSLISKIIKNQNLKIIETTLNKIYSNIFLPFMYFLVFIYSIRLVNLSTKSDGFYNEVLINLIEIIYKSTFIYTFDK